MLNKKEKALYQLSKKELIDTIIIYRRELSLIGEENRKLSQANIAAQEEIDKMPKSDKYYRKDKKIDMIEYTKGILDIVEKEGEKNEKS